VKENATHARHNQQGVTKTRGVVCNLCKDLVLQGGREARRGGGGGRPGGAGGMKEGSGYLRCENRQGYKATKEAHGHPVGGHLADPKVA